MCTFLIFLFISQNDLDRSQHERDSLHDQIQLQRETATSSHNRMQKHNLEKSAELYKTIQEQTGKLNEVHNMFCINV